MVSFRMKRTIVIRALLILAAIVLFIPSIPAVGLAESKIIIKPMISASWRLDSNFYKAEDNERDVYTYLLQPGIQLGWETAKSEVLLSYTLEAYFYDDKSDVPPGEVPADDENYVGHLAVFDAKHSLTDRLTLGLHDSFYITREAAESDKFSNSIDRKKYTVNRLTPLVFYDFENRFSVGLRYRWTDIDYADADGDDSTEERWLCNLLYNPTRTTTLDLDYQRWTLDYKLGGAEYTSDQIKLLLQKRYKYFAFNGGIGYHNRSFEDPDLGDQDTIAYILSVTGQNPPPPEQTRRLGQQYLRAKSHIYFAAERNFNNLGYYYDMFTADRFTMSTGHVFQEKILAGVKGYYQISDYIETDRKDDTYDISASIGYLIKKEMTLSFIAGREERDSNWAGYDYKNRYFMLKFDFNFDIGSRAGYTEEASYYR